STKKLLACTYFMQRRSFFAHRGLKGTAIQIRVFLRSFATPGDRFGGLPRCTLRVFPQSNQSMPRRSRLDLPDVPVHITHRGVNRAAVFIDDEDRCHYLRLLERAVSEREIKVHAYVLMDNHV